MMLCCNPCTATTVNMSSFSNITLSTSKDFLINIKISECSMIANCCQKVGIEIYRKVGSNA